MKNIKKLLVFILIAVSLFALTACDNPPQIKQLTELTLPELGNNQMAVIVKNGDSDYTSYTVTLTDGGINTNVCEDVLEYLRVKSGLTLIWQDSTYGKFITAIGGITAEGNSYVEVFTSNVQYQGTWAGVDKYEVEGVSLVAASVGVTDLKVAAGDVVYFELGSF